MNYDVSWLPLTNLTIMSNLTNFAFCARYQVRVNWTIGPLVGFPMVRLKLGIQKLEVL